MNVAQSLRNTAANVELVRPCQGGSPFAAATQQHLQVEHFPATNFTLQKLEHNAHLAVRQPADLAEARDHVAAAANAVTGHASQLGVPGFQDAFAACAGFAQAGSDWVLEHASFISVSAPKEAALAAFSKAAAALEPAYEKTFAACATLAQSGSAWISQHASVMSASGPKEAALAALYKAQAALQPAYEKTSAACATWAEAGKAWMLEHASVISASGPKEAALAAFQQAGAAIQPAYEKATAACAALTQKGSAWVLEHAPTIPASAPKEAALVAFHKAQAAAVSALGQLTSSGLRPAALQFQAVARTTFVRLRHQLQDKAQTSANVSLSTEAASAMMVVAITSALLLPLRLCCGSRGGRQSRSRTRAPPSRVVQGASAVRSLSPPPASPPPESARRSVRPRG